MQTPPSYNMLVLLVVVFLVEKLDVASSTYLPHITATGNGWSLELYKHVDE